MLGQDALPKVGPPVGLPASHAFDVYRRIALPGDLVCKEMYVPRGQNAFLEGPPTPVQWLTDHAASPIAYECLQLEVSTGTKSMGVEYVSLREDADICALCPIDAYCEQRAAVYLRH